MKPIHNTAVEWWASGFYHWSCSCGAAGTYATEKVAEETARRHRKMYNIQEKDMKNTNRRGVPAKTVTSKTIATFPRVRRYYRVYDNGGIRSQWMDKDLAIEQARVANNNGEVKTWVVEYEEEEA